jgi:hypothetical protein
MKALIVIIAGGKTATGAALRAFDFDRSADPNPGQRRRRPTYKPWFSGIFSPNLVRDAKMKRKK